LIFAEFSGSITPFFGVMVYCETLSASESTAAPLASLTGFALGSAFFPFGSLTSSVPSNAFSLLS
jgi:hypothetical protein